MLEYNSGQYDLQRIQTGNLTLYLCKCEWLSSWLDTDSAADVCRLPIGSRLFGHSGGSLWF